MSFSQYSFLQQLTSVRVVSTSNLSGSYLNGALNNGVGATLTAASAAVLTIDGVNVNQGDRVLLAGQSSASQNGVYVVSSPGSASSIWVLTRAEDQQNIEQFKAGQFIPVNAGTALAGSIYVLVEPLPTHLGIDNLVYKESAAPGAGQFLQIANNLSDVASVATARSNLGAQASANIKAGTTNNIGGSGVGPIAVSVTGITASSVVVASVATSSNATAVAKAVAGSGTFNVTFTADPGATCTLNYVVFIAAQ